jgi:hypothetical protein
MVARVEKYKGGQTWTPHRDVRYDLAGLQRLWGGTTASEGCDAELEVMDMLDLELFWLEWTTGQGSAVTISLILLGLVLALFVYAFLLSTRLRIAQEIFGNLNVFGPPLFSIKEIGCAILAVLLVVMAILTGLWIFALR